MTAMFVRKLPFIKAIILSDLTEDVEVFRYADPEIEFS